MHRACTLWLFCRVYEHRLWIKHCTVHRFEQHHLGARHRLHFYGAELRFCCIRYKNFSESEVLPRGQEQGLLRVACDSKQHLYGSRQFLVRRLSWHRCSASNVLSWDWRSGNRPNFFYSDLHFIWNILRGLLVGDQRHHLCFSCARNRSPFYIFPGVEGSWYRHHVSDCATRLVVEEYLSCQFRQHHAHHKVSVRTPNLLEAPRVVEA